MTSTWYIRAIVGTTLVVASLALPEPAHAIEAILRRCDAREFPRIFLNLTVTTEINGQPGQPIEPPLQAEDFSCTENGEPQDELDVFAPGSGAGVRGADVVFLIDASGSMGDKIEEVRNNVKAFVDELEAQGLSAGVALGLVRFGGGDGSPFLENNGSLVTGDIELFKSFIDRLGASGGYEPGFSALREAVLGFDFSPGAQKIFILISDEDSDSENGGDRADEAEKARTISLLLENEVRVFTAVDCTSGFSNSDYCDETSVTAATGGMQFAVTDPLSDIIPVIASEVGDTYVVRYRTADLALDGQERRVRCTVMTGGEQDVVECSYTPKSAPEIDLTLETKGLTARRLERGERPKIGAIVTDAAEPLVESVTLFYRTTGTAQYGSLTMSAVGNDIFEAELPPVAPPGVDFYLRATDGVEFTSLPSVSSATESFQIAVQPNSAPFISHNPRGRRVNRPNENVTITAFVRDQTQFLDGVELRWRNEGDLFFERIPMTRVSASAAADDGGAARTQQQEETDGTYTAVIPAARVTAPVEYYIRAKDNQGVAATFGTPDEPCPNCQVVRGLIAIRQPGARPLPRP